MGKLQIPKVENESLKDFIFRFINNNGVQEVNINNNTESGKKYHRTIFEATLKSSNRSPQIRKHKESTWKSESLGQAGLMNKP